MDITKKKLFWWFILVCTIIMAVDFLLERDYIFAGMMALCTYLSVDILHGLSTKAPEEAEE